MYLMSVGHGVQTSRLTLNGLKLWSPVTRVSSVVLKARGVEVGRSRCGRLRSDKLSRVVHCRRKRGVTLLRMRVEGVIRWSGALARITFQSLVEPWSCSFCC